MTGSPLRFLSLVVLTAIIGISAARVICWLPCEFGLAPQPQSTAAAHCGHAPEGSEARLVDGQPACDSCEDVRLADGDRLASRASLLAATGPALSAVAQQRPSSPRLVRPAAEPPDRRISAPVPLPLRI